MKHTFFYFGMCACMCDEYVQRGCLVNVFMCVCVRVMWTDTILGLCSSVI